MNCESVSDIKSVAIFDGLDSGDKMQEAQKEDSPDSSR